ncbi:MAG TPA: DUF4160 domain-containing protein [Rubricoccaceae bacterium]|nr:DUF4160 domain-containing protein [Rubricoccaceae bacterium]
MPVVLRVGPYRFLIYPGDRGEPMHVHVKRERMKAKVWLDSPPGQVAVANPGGFSAVELRRIERLVRAYRPQLIEAWHELFRD